MKKLIPFLMLLMSCAVQPPMQQSNTNGNACQKPQYIATVAKLTGTVPEAAFLYTLTKEAQSTFGSDVTIQNIRYDRVNGRKVSAVYDVVRCDTSAAR